MQKLHAPGEQVQRNGGMCSPREKEAGKEQDMSFKVGDLVRAVDNHYVYTCLDNNWIGKITKIDSGDTFEAETVLASCESPCSHYWGLSPRHFTLLSCEDIEQLNSNRPNENKVVLLFEGDYLMMSLIRERIEKRTAKIKVSNMDGKMAEIIYAGINAAISQMNFEERDEKKRKGAVDD